MAPILKQIDVFKNGIPFYIGETVFKSSLPTFMHSHDFYELFVIQKGAIIHIINDQKYLVKENEICFVHPADQHCFLKVDKYAEAVMVNIAFTSSLLHEVMVFLFGDLDSSKVRISSHMLHVDAITQANFKDLVSQLYNIQSFANATTNIASLKCLLSSVILSMSEKRDVAGLNIPMWLAKCTKEMSELGNFEKGIEQFVKLSGRTQEHLTRSLRKYMDVSPTQFINKLRLQKAAHLIRSTSIDITHIAFDTGFNNISHFNKLFKKQYGAPPRVYRQESNYIIDPKQTTSL